jgi:membrane associated rhomboid family serine protease
MEESEIIPEAGARIVARSRKQAMDWSLVLASQDIQPVITPPGEKPEWALLIEPSQHERALAAIQQYRLENRGWSWRRELPGGNIEIHSGALFWCLALAFAHWVVSFVDPSLKAAGQMDSAAVRAGEWYRLFTPILLHSDLAHLMANVTFGILVLGLSMARFGPGATLLATYLAGAFGNLMGLWFYSHPYTGVGASGMMMGALGFLCTHSIGLWRKSPKAARFIFSGVFAGFLLFVLFGLDPSSDVLAHFGGFLAGLVFGAILSCAPETVLQMRWLNQLLLTFLIAAIGLTWGLAVR